MRTFALVPAAGHSRRMGRPKLTLPLGGSTVLERVINALRCAAVDSILVVLGPHVADLTPLARQAGAEVLLLPAETPDMRATVEQGLLWIAQRWRPEAEDCWLLVPADSPTLQPEVVAALSQAGRHTPEAAVVVPTFAGQRGHPTLIRWRLAADLPAFDRDRGINAFLRQQAEQTLELPLQTPTILTDLDTLADYQRLLTEQAGSPTARHPWRQ